MDGFRCSPPPRLTRPPYRLTRRRALGGLASGLALALAGASGLTLRPEAARAAGSLILTNPASRVLLPGEAGLNQFGLDFTLTGPPAVFFAAADTPGWSESVKSSVDGFLFGYASTLTKQEDVVATGRAVQICVHHGFTSEGDAEIAWRSLTAALASGSQDSEHETVRSLDLVQLIVVEGQSILASVANDDIAAIVLASRSGDDLVTVAIADTRGNQPTAEEALKLAEAEGEKLKRSREIERTSVKSAFDAQWTPGFQLGSASGAPFFAWPTFLDNAPVTIAGETADQLGQRTATNREVAHQSHVEGPLWESAPIFDTHQLYFSAQSNFFDSSKLCKNFHGETEERLRAGMPDATIAEIRIGSTEKRLAYQTGSSYGSLTGITLHRIVTDGDFPTSLTLHIVAVPYRVDAELSIDEVVSRLDIVIRSMRDGMEGCLVSPHTAPLVVTVNAAV